MSDVIEIVVRFALTSLLVALLTLMWRHGRRWFRSARKFLRTGRWQSGPGANWRRTAQPQPMAPRIRMPKITAELRLPRQPHPPSAPSPFGRSPNGEGQGQDERINIRF